MKVHEAENSGIRERKKLGKNRKKGWRKNVKINDVEDFIDDVRLQERTGGLVSLKADEDLFFVEKKISDPSKESSVQRHAPLKPKKDLKCFRSLVNTSKSEVPIKPNKVSQKIKRKKKKESKVIKESTKPIKISKPKTYDLWEDSIGESNGFVKDIATHFKRTTCSEPVKVPNHRFQKTSLIDAVEVPHEGTSCNPSYNSHQELLGKAHDVEVKKLKDVQKLKRALDDKFPSKSEAPNQETWLNEMSQGILNNESSEDDNSETEFDFVQRNPPIRGDQRKLRSKKRKEKSIKIQKNLKNKEKVKRKAENEIHRLKQIKKEIHQGDEFSKLKKNSRVEKQANKLYEPTRKGKYRYEEPDLEVALTEDLSDSLRLMKTDGNLLEDRYKSFQKRNLLPTTVKQKIKRKYKLKKYTKRSHRES